MAEEGRIWSPYIKWSVLSSGYGGGKLAALFFYVKRDEAIGNRVLLINTARSDLESTIKEAGEHIGDGGEQAKSLLETIRGENIESFGPPAGAGNFWKEGENAAKEDFEKEELIRRRVETLHLGMGDAIFEITTLGGGTGSGSIPFIIDKMKGDSLGPLAENKHFAVAVWPELKESNLRHFNAICGLSRLLKFGEDAHQNADMVILIDNTILADKIPRVDEQSEKYFEMNKIIAEAMKLLMAPSRGRSFRTLTPSDYVTAPSAIGVYHATPCISLNNDIERVDLETALYNAVDNPLFPIDPSTSTFVWFITRVPKKHYDKGDFEYVRLNEILKDWTERNIGDTLRYSVITYTEDESINTFDVLLLLGGFKLDKLVLDSYDKYFAFKRNLESKARVDLMEDLERIESNLKNYIAHTGEVVETLKG